MSKKLLAVITVALMYLAMSATVLADTVKLVGR